MIQRHDYINILSHYRDKPVIKIVTGLRHCGKTTLFKQFQEQLKREGVSEEQILNLNFAESDQGIQTGKDLYDYVKARLQAGTRLYIFLDGVHLLPGFIRTVFGLSMKKECDIYMAGPSAHLLDEEHTATLSGRYVEIKMLPLSFSDYVSAHTGDKDVAGLFEDFITNSALPYALELPNQKARNYYLNGIYDTIILRDVVAKSRYPDLALLQGLLGYLAENIGVTCSTKSILDGLIYSGIKLSFHTLESYIAMLTDTSIIYRMGRYDIKGIQYLKTGDKYYASDIGFLTAILGKNKLNPGQIIENMVFHELLRRGNEVCIGKVGIKEVDFVSIGQQGIEYYQIAETVVSADNILLKHELAPLKSIKDHHPKFLLTLDPTPQKTHNGIRQMNVLEWLVTCQ
ncbi:MAG: ATP-binding protein [Holophagaceae bacterium]|nr:ATP-binding protein [Holophagaceae bacterium]